MEQHAVSDHLAPDRQPKLNDGYAGLSRTMSDGLKTLELQVDGVHCGGCIQKIESRLKQEPDITNARLNFSTRKLTVNWRGEAANANTYVGLIEGLGYTVRAFDPGQEMSGTIAEERFLLLCMAVSGFAMGNIMLLSLGLWTTTIDTMGHSTRDFMHWVSGLIAIPVVIFSGRPFFRSAIEALSHGRSNMDVPISVALILTTLTSFYQTVHHAEHAYFDSVVMLIFFLLIGRYLDFRARRSARSAATDLLSTLAGFAVVVEGDKTTRVPIRDLVAGMVVQVAVGEKFPIDGKLLQGQSNVDTSLITGETTPRAIIPGDTVYAGTMNLGAPVTIEVLRAAEDTLLADIVRLMEKAAQGQALYIRLADRVARFYTPVVHLTAACAFVFWWGFMGLPAQPSLMIAITVLIITCPCAIALAVPVVQVVASGRLMKQGILVKSGDALERLADIDVVLMDKTGTLTQGQPVLTNTTNPQSLQLAASLASHSHHPYSQAITAAYQGPLLPLENVTEQAGMGLRATYQGHDIRLGNHKWCGVNTSPDHEKMEIYLDDGVHNPVAFHFTDDLRPDAIATIRALKQKGLRIILISGDRTAIVTKMAQAAGIDESYGEQTPPQKYAFMERLRAEGHRILMVGDGLNDAPALAGANISIAPGSAIDMAQNAADIVFMGNKLAAINEAHSTACFSQRLVRENFVLTFIYNIIAIPMAIAGWVTPLIAALAMSGSSLVVIGNSFRLKNRSWTF